MSDRSQAVAVDETKHAITVQEASSATAFIAETLNAIADAMYDAKVDTDLNDGNSEVIADSAMSLFNNVHRPLRFGQKDLDQAQAFIPFVQLAARLGWQPEWEKRPLAPKDETTLDKLARFVGISLDYIENMHAYRVVYEDSSLVDNVLARRFADQLTALRKTILEIDNRIRSEQADERLGL